MLGFNPLCTRPICSDPFAGVAPPPAPAPDTHDGLYDLDDIRRLYELSEEFEGARRKKWKSQSKIEASLRRKLEDLFEGRPDAIEIAAPVLKSKAAVKRGEKPKFVLSTKRLEDLMKGLEAEIARIERLELIRQETEDDELLFMMACAVV